MRAVIIRSPRLEFVQLPIAICRTSVPSISLILFILSGEDGQAASGESSERFISITLSYFASASADSGLKESGLFWAVRNFLVSSSEGKMLVVTPISAPIFVIVARCGTVNLLTASPKYSIIQPTLPFVVRMPSSFRTISFADTQSCNCPVSLTPSTFGHFI